MQCDLHPQPWITWTLPSLSLSCMRLIEYYLSIVCVCVCVVLLLVHLYKYFKVEQPHCSKISQISLQAP